MIARTLALAALLAATPATAGSLMLGITSAGLLLPAAAGAPTLACPPCATVPPTRPELTLLAPIRFPSRGDMLGERAALEPVDLAAFEALRTAHCLEGSADCLNWHPAGIHFSWASARARP